MKALIVGCGVSGRSAGDFLQSKGYDVQFVSDENLKNFKSDDIDRLLTGLSFIVKSPGVAYDNKIIKSAIKKGVEVVGEMEVGASIVKGDVIAVTGTNGKTTTVSLVNHLLQLENRKVYIGGNIGVPITSFVDVVLDDDIVVLECSSFQLESCKNFRPKIAVVLNISEDHLNRHKTISEYIRCKMNITKNQKNSDYLLLNYDSEMVMKNKPKTNAKIYYFSTKNKVVGCYIKRGCIYFNDNLSEKKLVSLSKIKLIGEHNKSNILAAVLSVYLLTKNINLFKSLNSFYGVEHRIEFVKTINKISFYNDSKATNIDSVLVALKSFKNGINLILGGSDKGYGFDDLFKNLPKNVKNIAIFGETRNKIAFFAQKYKFKNFCICDNLKAATLFCYTHAKPNEIVLLSPACASFDCFLNFEERGNIFKKIVMEIAENEISLMENK